MTRVSTSVVLFSLRTSGRPAMAIAAVFLLLGCTTTQVAAPPPIFCEPPNYINNRGECVSP